jgi:2OG-Fe(II) oxygenase superfamily
MNMTKHTKSIKDKATKSNKTINDNEDKDYKKNNIDGFPQQLLLDDCCKTVKVQYQVPIVLLQNKIWVISNFFTNVECESWINYFENEMKIEYISHPSTRTIASRECYRCHKNDPIMAQRIFDRITNSAQLGLHSSLHDNSNLLPQFRNEIALTCNPNIRLYKYTKGMSFGQHVDDSNTLPGLGTTRFTVLIYLSSCTGGATRFEKNLALFEPVQGSLLVHIHGNDCLLHEADPVQSGIKYVLRTDLVYKKI